MRLERLLRAAAGSPASASWPSASCGRHAGADARRREAAGELKQRITVLEEQHKGKKEELLRRKKETADRVREETADELTRSAKQMFIDERWDVVMLVRHASVAAFLAMAENQEYLAGTGHRLAALEDSRLIPAVDSG